MDQRLENLIINMKKSGFLTNEKVEKAIRKISRHMFLPVSLQDEAYEDIPLPIMKNQTISQPSVVARMTEWLDVKEGQKILEVGSGSGWQSAILSYLVGNGKVYSIEKHEELAEFAKKNLESIGINNVEVIIGDGSTGLENEAPFDRIIITAACKKIPEALKRQLANEGLLIAPVGEHLQSLVLIKKTRQGIIEIKNQSGYVFVPLLGKDNESK